MTLEQHNEANKLIGEPVWSGGRIWLCVDWHSEGGGTIIMLHLVIGQEKKQERMDRVRRAF